MRKSPHIIDAVLGEPVEGLEEEQHGEQGDEFRVEVVAEHGEGETGLRQGVPEAFHQVFEFGGAQRAEEDLLHQLAGHEDEDERLEVDDGHARVRFGDVDHRGVELFLRVVGIAQDDASQRQTGETDACDGEMGRKGRE